MAATVTIDWGNVIHTMPDRFAFVDLEAYSNDEYPLTGMRNMMFGIGAEGYRVIAHLVETGTPSSPESQWANRINVAKYLADRAVSDEGRTVGIGTSLRSGPASIPSSADPRNAGDLQTSGSRSPTNHKDWLSHLKNTLGLTVDWMEFFNEPGTQATAWFNTTVSGYTDRVRACADWCAVHHRQFADPIIADAALHGSTRLCAAAGVGPYDGEMLRHIVGQGFIASSLLSNSSVGHFDSFSEHSGYGSFRSTSSQDGRQSVLNCAADPTWQDGNTGKAGHIGHLLRIRAQLDANGGSSKFIDDTEWQPDGGWTMPYAKNWMRAVMQSLQYINCFRYAGQLKLKSKTLMSIAIDDFGTTGYGGGLILGTRHGGPYSYSVAAYNLLQQIHPFSRNYKRQVDVQVTTNPNTPGGTKANPQPAIHCAAGLDADGNFGILVANIDLTNSQVVNFVLSDAPANSGTQVRCRQSNVNGTALATTGLEVGASFQQTLEPGEVSFIELPASSPLPGLTLTGGSKVASGAAIKAGGSVVPMGGRVRGQGVRTTSVARTVGGSGRTVGGGGGGG